jgi:hypothetical protein
MIPQIGSKITREGASFFFKVMEGDIHPAELYFAVLVTLTRNKSYKHFQPWLRIAWLG